MKAGRNDFYLVANTEKKLLVVFMYMEFDVNFPFPGLPMHTAWTLACRAVDCNNVTVSNNTCSSNIFLE